MGRDPMERDVDAAGHPDPVVALRIVEEAGERRGAPRPAGEAAVQADRHHLGLTRRTFGVEEIKGVLEIGVKLIPRVETLRRRKAHIVGVERIGDD